MKLQFLWQSNPSLFLPVFPGIFKCYKSSDGAWWNQHQHKTERSFCIIIVITVIFIGLVFIWFYLCFFCACNLFRSEWIRSGSKTYENTVYESFFLFVCTAQNLLHCDLLLFSIHIKLTHFKVPLFVTQTQTQSVCFVYFANCKAINRIIKTNSTIVYFYFGGM